MNDTDKLYSYFFGTLDHLISTYCINYGIDKKTALADYIMPKLSFELKQRDYSILTETEFESIVVALKEDISASEEVETILNEYSDAIRKIMMYTNKNKEEDK